MQLARIAGALGIKPSVDEPPSDDRESQQHLAALIGSLPSTTMPKIMTPEDYLQDKEQRKHAR